MAPALKRFLAVFFLVSSALWASKADSSFQRLAGLPIIAYTQETKVLVGATTMVFFKPNDFQPYGDQIDIAVMRTQNKQNRLTALWKSYWFQGKVYAENKFNFRACPGNYYCNFSQEKIDAERYDMLTLQVDGRWLYGLEHIFPWTGWLEPFSWGVEYDIEYNSAKFANKTAANDIIHSGNRVGLGISIVRDTRDNVNYASTGSYLLWRQLFYPKQLGSTHEFINTIVQYCHFIPLFNHLVLALGVYGQGTWGDVPFDRLAIPDGTYQMRGLEKGIWRDKQQLVWQSEVRFPLFWRLGGVVFAEAAQLGSHFSGLLRSPVKFDVGMGGRFVLNAERKLNARADLSWVNQRLGVTIYYNEAF